MTEIHIAIVEDEEIYRNQLTEYITRFQKETGSRIALTCFCDGDEIIEKYSGGYDIILMDIQMQFMDGMTAAEKIRALDEEVIIIFITNMTSYALRGYEVDAMDYIVKPVEYFSFSQKLLKAVRKLGRRKGHFISIPIESGIQKLETDDIYFFEVFGHNVVCETKKGEFQSRITMQEIEKNLSQDSFFRISRNCLVNLKYVDGVEEGNCVIHGENLQISRKRRKDFIQALMDYMGGMI